MIDENVINNVIAFRIALASNRKLKDSEETLEDRTRNWTVRQLLEFLFLNTESATAFIMPWANAKFGVTIPPPYDDESIANAERDTLRKLRSAGKKIYHRR